jgi:hypothetical protein
MHPIMKDAIDGWDEVLPALLRDGSTGVAVAVEAWEVAAGDLQPYAMPGAEDQGRGAEIQP